MGGVSTNGLSWISTYPSSSSSIPFRSITSSVNTDAVGGSVSSVEGTSSSVRAPTVTSTLAIGASDSELNWHNASPGRTTSSTSFNIVPMTPLRTALISCTALSVCSSTIGSPTLTGSPAILNHFPTDASKTDSPKSGATISSMYPCVLSVVFWCRLIDFQTDSAYF